MHLLQTLGFTPNLSTSSSYTDKRLAVYASKGQRMGLCSSISSYPFLLPCNGWNSSESRAINNLELDCSKMGKRFAVCGSKGQQMGGHEFEFDEKELASEESFEFDEKELASEESFEFDEKELASEESLWNLYERWYNHFAISRDADEKRKRFSVFKEMAKLVCEHNKQKDVSYTLGLNDFSDTSPEEMMLDLSPDKYPELEPYRHLIPDDQ